MTAPAGQPGPGDLPARVFRALYPGYDLHAVGGTHVVVPKGTALLAAPTLSEIARQLASPGSADPAAGAPVPVPLPQRPAPAACARVAPPAARTS